MLEGLFTLLPINLVEENSHFFNKISLHKQKGSQTYLCICHFDTSKYNIKLYDAFSLHLPSRIKNSVEKRQAEYLAGRYAANIALKCLNVKDIDIGTGEHGSPIWPLKVRGSITHTKSIAACIISSHCEQDFVGIDIEHWLSKELYDQLNTSIIDENEKLYLLSSNINSERALTITFSAKEALYKAIYPYVNSFLDFDTSTVKELSDNYIKLQLGSAYLSSISCSGEGLFICNYFAYEDAVLTIITSNHANGIANRYHLH